MSKDDEANQDAGIARVLEISGLVNIFLSMFDSLKARKFSKDDSIDITERFILNTLGYKASMNMQEEMDNQGQEIIFVPVGPDDHMPGCSNGPH